MPVRPLSRRDQRERAPERVGPRRRLPLPGGQGLDPRHLRERARRKARRRHRGRLATRRDADVRRRRDGARVAERPGAPLAGRPCGGRARPPRRPRPRPRPPRHGQGARVARRRAQRRHPRRGHFGPAPDAAGDLRGAPARRHALRGRRVVVRAAPQPRGRLHRRPERRRFPSLEPAGGRASGTAPDRLPGDCLVGRRPVGGRGDGAGDRDLPRGRAVGGATAAARRPRSRLARVIRAVAPSAGFRRPRRGRRSRRGPALRHAPGQRRLHPPRDRASRPRVGREPAGPPELLSFHGRRGATSSTRAPFRSRAAAAGRPSAPMEGSGRRSGRTRSPTPFAGAPQRGRRTDG